MLKFVWCKYPYSTVVHTSNSTDRGPRLPLTSPWEKRVISPPTPPFFSAAEPSTAVYCLILRPRFSDEERERETCQPTITRTRRLFLTLPFFSKKKILARAARFCNAPPCKQTHTHTRAKNGLLLPLCSESGSLNWYWESADCQTFLRMRLTVCRLWISVLSQPFEVGKRHKIIVIRNFQDAGYLHT